MADVHPSEVTRTDTTGVTITPSPKPTLTNKARESYILDLIQNNNGCQLPCWWGLTPGKSTWEEAEQLAQDVAARVRSQPLDGTSGDIFHSFSVDSKGEPLYDSLAFVESQGRIDAVLVRGHSRYSPTGFESLWMNYSPGQLLKTYGAPSRVLLQAPGQTGVGTSGKTGYSLWLFYDQQGFMLRYDGGVADLPIYHICPDSEEPSLQIYRMDLNMQTLHNSRPLEWDDSILVREMNEDTVKTIQEAAGLSVEEFYELFLQKDEPHCFDTPHNIWPVR